MKLLRIISLMAIIASIASVCNKANANIAQDLTANYNKIVNNCGSRDKPAYLCSGNLIRFTSNINPDTVEKKAGVKYTWPWEPNMNKSTDTTSVSFMYARRDINIRIEFNNKYFGVIYYPPMIREKTKWNAEFLCAFPIDADSDYRGVTGCGKNTDSVGGEYTNGSDPCQSQGIYTADAWYEHYKPVPKYDGIYSWARGIHQCGFDLTSTVENKADIFNQMLKARQLVFEEVNDDRDNYVQHNEMLLKAWPADSNGHIANAQNLPIQAFFYTVGSNGESGLKNAQDFQKAYYDLNNHVIIPIVKLTQDSNFKKVLYSYVVTDQEVNP